jgi:dolichol-phosphate mannosyltransferase
MSGFFLFRRSLVDGVRLRPMGFKVLLDIIVRAKPSRIVAVPLELQPRTSGVSSASMAQGILYLRHLARLLRDSRIVIPLAGLREKFAAGHDN